MKIQLLHIADCPNARAARRMLDEALRELGLLEEILEIEVCDSAHAEQLAFPGSPTIRIDGKDVETISSGQGGYGVSCRTYVIDGRRRGVPAQEIISKALRSAVAAADKEK